MKKNELTKKQKEDLEKFGANTWFVEYLYKQYQKNPAEIPEQWQKFFGNVKNGEKGNGKTYKTSYTADNSEIELPKPEVDDEVQIIAGSSARILDNMNASLSVPVATSQRTIPVKLLEENRIIINRHLQKNQLGKISFTHLISWAILKALQFYPVLNCAFTVIDGKPRVIKRKKINLGLAIDIEKKDGSRSLIVPNIKNAGGMGFKEFVLKYEDLVARSREGQLDPSEFTGTTITLTNPGTIGTVTSVPRLMTGQGTIIATGAIQYPAEYQAMSPSTISTLGVSKVMNITNTYDHRIIQGAESGLFLKKIGDLLLGEENFYGEIFGNLKIPAQPLSWKTDYQPGVFGTGTNTEEIEKQARVLQLINLYRVRGHLIASLDPLGKQHIYHPELDPASFKLTFWDYDRKFITGDLLPDQKTATLREMLEILNKTYCDKIGVEYMHIQNPDEKSWLQRMMEPVRNTSAFTPKMKKEILKKLITAETFEHFIHNRFIGHKRFSLEGSETLIPVLDYLFNQASDHDVLEVVLGMAHRGRLNVLGNIIGKSYESIFSEFEDIKDPDSIEGSGDVKYHLGAIGWYKTRNGKKILVSLASNPSHLEWVNPVVEGIVRAKQTRMNDKEHKKVLPLLIHGDAAFAGQGIVAETLNLSQLKGYRTGGSVHIIINNQIGFTTTPEDARSSQYATDVAKMIQAPIFHVNGDDPEASLWITKIAFEYRQKFKKDVVIDLFGYRRHGHNEGDEPGFTQPLLYEQISSHPSVREIYEKNLTKNKIITGDEVKQLHENTAKILAEAFEKIKQKTVSFKTDVPLAIRKETLDSIKQVKETSITEENLLKIVNGITSLPEDFSIHPKLKKFLEKRKKLTEGSFEADWAYAETIAFASLLLEGTPVRLSGQDSVRGTFSQRHLALTDIHTGKEYLFLNHVSPNQAKFEALDSLLSEAAVLGFEFGYSVADPLALVIWEAQFGDFANAAQVIIDNFIVASEEKWQVPNNIVLLLPHGYEGQGPEHSSARLERFLILCAEENIRVCNVSTPSQYFHLLRSHIKLTERKPLIIMTPKSLLRHPEAKSGKDEFIRGGFKEVIDDNAEKRDLTEKLIFTSGKIYYDLTKFRKEKNIKNTAIIRIEQFYPYKSEQIKNIAASYPNAKNVIWVQEEPKNMGAWNFLQPRLSEDIPNRQILYTGRPESASPAVGSAKISVQQQKELVEEAFKL
jgi:2-oxoglutarate dehydrogenase E1 component